MEKNKKDLMILISILFIGTNYAIYTHFITSQLYNVKQAKSKYIVQEQKLNDIKVKKQSIDAKKKQLEKLKLNTAKFDNMAPVDIDTPQLIYDFYNGCKLYAITGQNISFQLLDNNNDPNSNTVNTTTNNTNTNNSSNDIKKEANKKFYTLTIDLKIQGDKANIEKFIQNLGAITNRKLNVKSITISSVKDSVASKYPNNTGNNENTANIQSQLPTNNSNANSNKTQTDANNVQVPANQLSAEVIFYQYVQGNVNSQSKALNNYEFYDSQKQGFNSISDMFK